MNLSVKKFRSMMQKKSNSAELQIFQLVPENYMQLKSGSNKEKLLNCDNLRLRRILQKYEEVFQDELPPGLAPERPVDDEIEINKEAKPPHSRLYTVLYRLNDHKLHESPKKYEFFKSEIDFI